MKNLNDILWDKENVEDIFSEETESQEEENKHMHLRRACIAPSCTRHPDVVGAYNMYTTIKCS